MTMHSNTATSAHRIVVQPLDRYGRYRVTDRDTGREWIAATRIPTCAAARVLQNLGAAPNDRLEMYREGRERPDLFGPIGWFAARTVVENERTGPVFAKYRPFDRTHTGA